MTLFDLGNTPTSQEVVNVASVPQRSPFRYPGGKTWLIPIVRKWLKQTPKPAPILIEVFAGGGIVSLTAAFEKLAEHVTMVEIDEEVAAVWEVILNGKNGWLAEKIYNYDLTYNNVKAELEKPNKALQDVAFCTILKNRVFHGGILAKGSGMIKNGENGKGLTSRWYPKTLRDRILAIDYIKNKITFIAGDAFEVLEKNVANPAAYFFIDPPYTIAGRRLYNHYDIDHEQLFKLTAQIAGKFMLTYDDTPEIRQLAAKYQLQYRTIPMKTTLHFQKNELIIADNFDWWPNSPKTDNP
ncbi:MAG: DNA adenine methylase [Cytophagia bacterium]|nr:MAG: DNA adenine methylase [Cytophagales bacterium]TAG35071.1 MAG: DNA adenine methylase [Cytophagia bacterium]TAG71887.1 MAG: DNA adenine methylase [Runella slithyformis]TAG77010.1 MAG: DNA adenine methylase [Cytophagales bacterium]